MGPGGKFGRFLDPNLQVREATGNAPNEQDDKTYDHHSQTHCPPDIADWEGVEQISPSQREEKGDRQGENKR
jgi:hypothetical protein